MDKSLVSKFQLSVKYSYDISMAIEDQLQSLNSKFEKAHQKHLENLVHKQVVANMYSQVGSNAKLKKVKIKLS